MTALRAPQQRPEIDTALVDDIGSFIQRYVVLPSDSHARVLSYWIVHTYTFDAAYVTPYMLVYSKQPGSGKTRLLDTVQVLARNAVRADDMTPSVMFKLIARECPTMLTDEIDTIWSGTRNESKRRIYNTGYKKGGSAWREQARELVEFSTFCPKMLAGINNGFLPATIKDRCIPIELERRAKGQKVERFNEMEVNRSPEREKLLDRIMEFKENFYVDLTAQFPEPIPTLTDRQDEITEPLRALAALFGREEEIADDLETVFAAVSKSPTNPTTTIMRRIRDAFAGQGKVFTEDLCDILGPAYNGRTLALWLEPHGIFPKDIRIGNNVKKGYTADDFVEAWQTHLGLEPV